MPLANKKDQDLMPMPMPPAAVGKTLALRQVSVGDSRFILGLRQDGVKGKYLSRPPDALEDQERYINQHLTQQQDHYFVVTDLNTNRLGTVRIYDISEDSFTWGSWIIRADAPPSAGLESALLVYDFAFIALGLRIARFDVRKQNRGVIRFHKSFGAKHVEGDEENEYFSLSWDAYRVKRTRLWRIV